MPRATSPDLGRLAYELKEIAEYGWLPDGDGVTTPVILWAEGWLLTLSELGIAPTGERKAPGAREQT